MCYVYENVKVIRRGKNSVTKREYSAARYPYFCSGTAYTMSTDVVVRLYQLSSFTPFYVLEDVLVTGFLVAKAGNIKHVELNPMYVMRGHQFEARFTGKYWSSYIFAHRHNLLRVNAVWEKILRMVNAPKIRDYYVKVIRKAHIGRS